MWWISMSSQVGRGSESEAWGFELSVDDVVPLALLNMFKQTRTSSPKVKYCHLYKPDMFVDFIKGPQSSWDWEKHTPFPNRDPSKVPEPLWTLLKKCYSISNYFEKRHHDGKIRIQIELYLKSSNNVPRQTEMRGRDDAAWFSWSHYHYHSGNITPVRLNTPPQLSVSAISFSFSLLVLDLKCVYTDNSFYTLS